MDLDNIKVSVLHENNMLEEGDMSIEIDAEKQIADYIKTFKRLPSKNVWFLNEEIGEEPYRVSYCRVTPLNNEVYCQISFN